MDQVVRGDLFLLCISSVLHIRILLCILILTQQIHIRVLLCILILTQHR